MTNTTTVTVLFTDVVGNTALRQRLGDAAAERVLQDHSKVIRDQIGPCGGREVKTIGDSFMVAFDSARKAVDCAIAIQRALADRNRGNPGEQVQVRIGINAGEATEEQRDLFGTAVNAAKYIEGKAQPDQILVPETVKALIGPVKDLTFVDRGRFRLKGFPERWRLYEVVWQKEATAAPALVERTPFVGREAERADLRRLLDQTARGQGALVMIGGEPGVGKTRLTEEAAVEARGRGFFTVVGHCYEMEGTPPYIPFIEAIEYIARVVPPENLRKTLANAAPEVARLAPELRRLFPDLPPPAEVPPEEGRRYLFNALRDFLERAARTQPIVFVLEDLHWADESSLLLLEHVAQRQAEMPVLLLGTYRDVELALARPLARTLQELLRQRLAHDMVLPRLPESAVANLLKAHGPGDPPPRLVSLIYGETEGNPFFVEEVIRHLREQGKLFDAEGRWISDVAVGELEVPRSVRLTIERRLERVSEGCRRLLTSAAVIGRNFSFQLLEGLGDLESDALLDAVDEAERSGLIQEVSAGRQAGYTFAHELIRQTLISGLSLPRRQRLHLRVAQAIERTYGSNLEPQLGALAAHYRLAGAAGDPEKAIDYSLRAGEAAFAVFAYEEAAAGWQGALELMEEQRAHAERRARLLERLGDLMYVSGIDYPKGIDYLEAALALYEEVDQEERAAQVHSRLGGHLSGRGGTVDLDRALEHYRAAEAVLSRGPERVPLGYLYTGMASAAFYAMRTEEGLAAGRRAVEIAERLGNEALWANAAPPHALHLFASGRLAEARALLERAWEVADQMNHAFAAPLAAEIRAICGYYLADPRDYRAWLERELAKPRLAQAPARQRIFVWHLGWVHEMEGDLPQARHCLAEVGLGPRRETFDSLEALLLQREGDWGSAETIWSGMMEEYRRGGNRWNQQVWTHWVARPFLARGDYGRAEAAFQESLAIAVEGPHLPAELWHRSDLAVLYAETGRPQEAQPHLARCREIMAPGEDWRGLAGRVALAEGAVAAAQRRLGKAEPLFEKAIETFRRYTLPWDEAEALHLWGRGLLSTGERARGIEKLDAAIDIYRRHGAGQPWIDRVDVDKPRI